LGATLLALSPQLPEHCAATRENAHLSFEVLSDAHNDVARRFGIVFRFSDDLARIYRKFNMDLAKFNGDPSWELPMPARYIIDRENIIRAADVNFDYTRRPEPSETLAVLRNLRATATP
jgi:peroxiredoxin